MKKNFNPFVIAVLFCLLLLSSKTKAQKLKPEEVIAKHLDSIGSVEKRGAIKNQIAAGVTQFTILRSSNSAASSGTVGRAVFLSENKKLYYGLNFEIPNYPFEKISFDGDKVSIGFINPGLRSVFGNFVQSNKNLFTEGLFGGALSSAWCLNDLATRKGKLSNSGKKKIDGREAYAIEYLPKGGSSLSIKMYFDAENFRHLRTEYKQTISAAQGLTPEASSRQMESRYGMTEDFSDYQSENGLMLPHRYRLFLSLDGGRGTNEFEWKFEFSQFAFNQNLDPKSFDIGAE